MTGAELGTAAYAAQKIKECIGKLREAGINNKAINLLEIGLAGVRKEIEKEWEEK